MVLASNKWLSNSGDDRKSTEVVTSSNSESKPAKANTANTELLESKFMSTTTKEADATAAGRTTEEELISTTEATLTTPTTTETALVDNANQNEEVPLTFTDQRQELEEQQKSFTDILKAMAANISNSDYAMNETTSFEGDLNTARATTQAPGALEQNEGEMENNNHASYTELIDATFNNMMASGLDSDPTDSNINILNSDLTVKTSNVPVVKKSSVAEDYIGTLTGMSNKASFLSSISIGGGGSKTNSNTTQTIVMNNANATMSSNKPVNPVYALDTTARPVAVLNVTNNSNSNNKNAHNINGDAVTSSTNGQAKIVLYCEQSSHPFQTRTILLTPNIECKVGRLIAKCKASESNAIFDCKVLSRNHAVLWYSDDGRFYVKDTKSSNGTFINDNKLGNDAAELHFGDIVKFGVDVLENSRKEVHGCIIASVKLYLPDGRQAISIDSNSLRSQYSGESRISFDDLHRLNVYMQETSQREKALKSKLYNIQNLLDATRKNSSTCWQAMISEDQLLHRIHSLEKKLQILEKNMPENALKNEIIKLIDDKSAYQHSAKEALRNVYLERCEAMQKLVKLECDFASSENECKILRDQITCTEEALRDISDRNRLLEEESNEFRNEAERQELEAKKEFEEQINKLTEKLKQRQTEYELLQQHVAKTLSPERSDTHSHSEEESSLQKEAIENLDAVIAGMDIGDDDDDDEEDAVDNLAVALQRKKRKRSKFDDVYNFNGSSDSSGNEKQGNLNLQANSSNKFIGGEATIMKWLKNSDMNTKEGSIDIFNAICSNESDSSDETEAISPDAAFVPPKELKKSYTKLEKMLENVRQHIKQLEIDIKENPADGSTTIKTEGYDEINSESESETESKLQEKTNDQKTEDEHSTKIKKTVFSLHRAFEEICDNFKYLRAAVVQNQKQSDETVASTTTQFQKVKNITKTSANIKLPEIDEVDDEHDSEEDNDNDNNDNDDNDSRRVDTIDHLEIEELKAKLIERDRDSQHMLEMLQIECETHKQKVNELLNLTEKLRQEQELITNDMSSNALRLPAALSDDVSGDGVSSDSGVSSVDKTTETATQLVTVASVNTSTNESINHVGNTVAAAAANFEQQMREELAAMNSSAVQREEELIAYKESLEASQRESLKLRQDLLQMQKQPAGTTIEVIMRTAIPMVVAVIGILVYLIITYF